MKADRFRPCGRTCTPQSTPWTDWRVRRSQYARRIIVGCQASQQPLDVEILYSLYAVIIMTIFNVLIFNASLDLARLLHTYCDLPRSQGSITSQISIGSVDDLGPESGFDAGIGPLEYSSPHCR
jgi:hypothetical protein